MLNKNDMYFGKSEISVKWIEKDFYTCSVSHQGLHYLQNITKCSACQSSFEEPVVDLTLPSNEDLLNGNAKIKCSVRISNLDVSQVSLKLNKILTTKIPSFEVDNTLKNTYTATFTVSQDEWKGINTVTCVVKRPCTSIPAEVSKEIDVNSPADIRNLYDDDGGEELGELEEINNVWTTTSTFIALFLVTLIYSGFVTFVKVK
ncbi:hypothetical protein GDO81_001786 [Engystomops pustulosus]|uniref:Ig-like domain-containing protein n=1 Tax=Engystomops pustulosus TaxID=76066 RepID=A0AAV7DFJ7_ENGPU|nr:hypothetical protein GDO81_001786 [Engystomops pustulosus]